MTVKPDEKINPEHFNRMHPSNLAAALAQVQANLPAIDKGETAEVKSERTGKTFKYKYADLADVSAVILPMLGAVGLSWITRPTINDGGKFVLAYELLHISGEAKAGEYPLSGGSAQEIGSAITYARRYALCAVTGVAPAADDDDGAAATRQAQRGDWDNGRADRDVAAAAETARQNILANARKAIDAAPVDGLPAIASRVTVLLRQEAINAEDAGDLADRIDARRGQLTEPEDRTADTGQSDLGAEWPEPRKPGSGDPA